jgi:hypothetical protein
MATNWICVSITRSIETSLPKPHRKADHDLHLTPTPSQNYAVVQATLPGIENLGYKFWIVWVSLTQPITSNPQTNILKAVICFSFIPVTYFFYPETANRSLEDIDRFFETNPPLIICRNELATQLSRPAVYAEMDDEIWRRGEIKIEGEGVEGKEKESGVVGVEKVG